jgi:hypothetical protein
MPPTGVRGRFDIAPATDQVVRVGSEINPDQAKEIFNARDKLVLPGRYSAGIVRDCTGACKCKRAAGV